MHTLSNTDPIPEVQNLHTQCEEGVAVENTSHTNSNLELYCPNCSCVFYGITRLTAHLLGCTRIITETNESIRCQNTIRISPDSAVTSPEIGTFYPEIGTSCQEAEAITTSERSTDCMDRDDPLTPHIQRNKVPIQCNKCDAQFKTKVRYKHHVYTKHRDPVPNRENNNKDKDEANVKTRRENLYECQTCGRTYSTKCNLNRHINKLVCGELKRTRKQLDASTCTMEDQGVVFNCGECAQEFTHKGLYEAHLIQEHDKEASHCRNCQKTFSSRCNLIRHVKKSACYKYSLPQYVQLTLEANELRALQVSGKDFPKNTVECEICKTKFSNWKYLELHEIYKHGEGREVKCMTCEATFPETHELVRHISKAQCKRINKFNKLYRDTFVNNMGTVCVICGKHFPRKSNYVSHMMRHQMKNLTTTKVNLKTKERPLYHCDVCNQMVKNLTSHKIVHQTERPFVCECGKKYKDEKSLRSHKVHNCGQVHHCPLCKQIFKDKHYLKMHIFRFHDVDNDTLLNAGKQG